MFSRSQEARPIYPAVGQNVYLAQTAYVGGDVTIGDECTIKHHVTLRGDVSSITIARHVNARDGTDQERDYGGFALDAYHRLNRWHAADHYPNRNEWPAGWPHRVRSAVRSRPTVQPNDFAAASGSVAGRHGCLGGPLRLVADAGWPSSILVSPSVVSHR
ncbi:MAG: hypothetical protein ACE5I3_10210 [Phycisphaerae bacterium]